MFLDTREHPPRKRKGTSLRAPQGRGLKPRPRLQNHTRIHKLTFWVFLDNLFLRRETRSLRPPPPCRRKFAVWRVIRASLAIRSAFLVRIDWRFRGQSR